MRTWFAMIHPPREDFIGTITEEEAAIMHRHADYLAGLLSQGVLIAAGPTWGQAMNDGVSIFEAEDEAAAQAILDADPSVASGLMTPELREMRLSFLRGRI